MTWGERIRGWFHRTGSEALGWTLIVLGLFMLVMPGPGLLAMLGGVALLARHYVWADRIFEPLEEKAIEAAKFGVGSIWRIAASVLGIIFVVSVGALWWYSPTIPEFSILGVGFGPKLPAGGWPGATGLWFSSLIALVLLVYSIKRWYPKKSQDPH
ncbi:MAG TPA: PGPGW domain-containing protein [Aeromicrobium sp.]|nr:PGPGW domain-containing protein [Aeromicrobium sp.]